MWAPPFYMDLWKEECNLFSKWTILLETWGHCDGHLSYSAYSAFFGDPAHSLFQELILSYSWFQWGWPQADQSILWPWAQWLVLGWSHDPCQANKRKTWGSWQLPRENSCFFMGVTELIEREPGTISGYLWGFLGTACLRIKHHQRKQSQGLETHM